MYRYSRSIILAAIETTYGTDAMPTPSSNAIITKGIPSFEITNNAKTRDVPLSYYGKLPPINVGESLTISFTTELKGSGSLGVASKYGPLFRACNNTEEITPGASVMYIPNSSLSGESATIYFHHDGRLHKLLGCVGSYSIRLVSQEIVTVDWKFTGMYASSHASTAIFPSPNYETVSPIIFKGANIIINSLNNLIVHELSFDLGNTISKRLNANSTTGIARYYISNREPKGSVLLEAVPIATINPYTLFDGSTQLNISATASGGEGNSCNINITGAVLEPPKTSDKENIMMWDLSFSIHPTLSSGNNEIVLTFT